MEKGTYIKPDGEKVEVSEFDAENKMVTVHVLSGQYKFYSEYEYSLWKKDGEPVLTGTVTKSIATETTVTEPKKEKKPKKK
jgi:hypothetical protein